MCDAMNVTIRNCNNIEHGCISVDEGTLNVKYAINGTGKTTISKAIRCVGGDISSLTPFKYLDNADNNKPEVIIDNNPSIIRVFDEVYLDQYTFLEDELLKDSFEIFVKTPKYTEQEQKIESIISRVSDVFKNDQCLEELIQVFQQFIAGFGKAKNGYSAAGSIAKGVGKGNKIANIPVGMEFYAPYLRSENNLAWLEWCLEGKSFVGISADECPCCASRSPAKERIEKLEENYDTKALKNFNAMLRVFDSLSLYFSEGTNEQVRRILSNADAFGEPEKRYLVEIKNQVEGLCQQLQDLRSLSFATLKESLDISSELERLRVDIGLYSHIQSSLSRQKIDEVNASLADLISEATQLKAEVGKQRTLIKKTVEEHQKDINDFLSLAGYPYHVILEEQQDGEYRLMLRHETNAIQNVHSVKGHLSFGERNALALALFMYSSLYEKADFIILDDPISSFDGNKKFALLDLLFLKDSDKCFKGKTILLFTHEFGIVIDIMRTMTRHFYPEPKASFLRCRQGTLDEITIARDDICSSLQIYTSHIQSTDSDLIKIIYYRRKLEVEGKIGNPEYNLLSSLLHKRENPTISAVDGATMMLEDDVATASRNIRQYIPGFDYANLLAQIIDRNAIRDKYVRCVSNFEKLHLFRLMFEVSDTSLDDISKKFVNEAYHIENEYLFCLDPAKYDVIPQFVIERLDKVVEESHFE